MTFFCSPSVTGSARLPGGQLSAVGCRLCCGRTGRADISSGGGGGEGRSNDSPLRDPRGGEAPIALEVTQATPTAADNTRRTENKASHALQQQRTAPRSAALPRRAFVPSRIWGGRLRKPAAAPQPSPHVGYVRLAARRATCHVPSLWPQSVPFPRFGRVRGC